ncbi:hypothetical protein NQ314_019119 [Rhamnusium bicolor]|uniref:Uncharacterized protein n=1 Tax=Rhamnusium bicolor TaxID=1586634 RepID=A0AAV8WNN8_9CUCU|nr:hypothetical protein NQ314_019119 [Rhamnusium bicolor]
MLGNFVKFLKNENERRINVIKFNAIVGFPSVSGCIDCTRIPIVNPGGDDLVAGPKMEISDIVVQHPDSTHDSVIFDRSAIRVRFEQGQICGLLSGDNGYACRSYLLTPVIYPTAQQEEKL